MKDLFTRLRTVTVVPGDNRASLRRMIAEGKPVGALVFG